MFVAQPIVLNMSSFSMLFWFSAHLHLTVQLQMTKPKLYKSRSQNDNREYRVDDRMTVEEMEDMIDSGNKLTFDYLALIGCASIIAGVGAYVAFASSWPLHIIGALLDIFFSFFFLSLCVLLSRIRKGIRNLEQT